jgi:hypothetical protein
MRAAAVEMPTRRCGFSAIFSISVRPEILITDRLVTGLPVPGWADRDAAGFTGLPSDLGGGRTLGAREADLVPGGVLPLVGGRLVSGTPPYRPPGMQVAPQAVYQTNNISVHAETIQEIADKIISVIESAFAKAVTRNTYY